MFKGRPAAFFILFTIFLMENAIGFFFKENAPALLLIAVLFYSFSEGPVFGSVAGLWAGFLLDLLGVGRIGFFMTAYAGVGLLSGAVSSKVFQEGFFTEILLPAACLLVVLTAEAWIILRASDEAAGPIHLLQAQRPWKILATVVVSPWLFSTLRKTRVKSTRGTLRRSYG